MQLLYGSKWNNSLNLLFSFTSKYKNTIETTTKKRPNNKIIIVYLFTFSCLLDFSSAFSSFFPFTFVVLTLVEVLDKLAELIVGILIFNPFPSYFSSKSSELVRSSSDISDSVKLPNLADIFLSKAFWYPFFFFFCSLI